MTPQRIQRQRTKGWRMPEGATYVGRPTLWGNPYTLDDVRAMFPQVPTADRRAVAVRLYRDQLDHFGLLSDFGWAASDKRYDQICAAIDATGARSMADYAPHALRGRDLACWCPLEDPAGNRVPCHADVLLKLANPGWRSAMTGAASTSWPMKAPIPRSARKAALHKLTEAGLVELDGDRYRMASEMHAEETAVRAALAAEEERG